MFVVPVRCALGATMRRREFSVLSAVLRNVTSSHRRRGVKCLDRLSGRVSARVVYAEPNHRLMVRGDLSLLAVRHSSCFHITQNDAIHIVRGLRDKRLLLFGRNGRVAFHLYWR